MSPAPKPKRTPGMAKAGDTYSLTQHSLSAHWHVRTLNAFETMPSYIVVDCGYGPRDSVAHRRGLATRDRLQAAMDAKRAWLTQLEITAIIDQVRAEVN